MVENSMCRDVTSESFDRELMEYQKELHEKENREREQFILTRKIYETVVNIQHDLDIERQKKKIEEMKNEVKKLNQEIGYSEDNLKYIQDHRYKLLEERY